MRRTKGTGTLSQRRDGLWVARLDLGGTPRVRKTFSSLDRATAERRMRAWLEEHRPERLESRMVLPRSHNMASARQIATHSDAQWLDKVRASGGACCHCQRPAPYGVKDHLIPVARGGSDGIDNVALSCRDCNAAKGAMTPDEFREWALERDFFTGSRPLTEAAALSARAFTPAQRDMLRQPPGQRASWWQENRRRYDENGERIA